MCYDRTFRPSLPIDSETLSNFCYKCTVGLNETDTNYAEWFKKHKENCQKNYDCSSNSMDVECAKRSIKKYSLRYMTMLSDGDSKAHEQPVSSKVYGDEHIVEKEECVNHVAKRMGTALNNIVAEAKSQGSSVSGKGKVTKGKILMIQNYYGRAIKDNAGDIKLMKKEFCNIVPLDI